MEDSTVIDEVVVEFGDNLYPVQIKWEQTYFKSRATRVFLSGQPTPSWDHPPYGPKGQNEENDKAWVKYNNEEVRIMRAFLKLASEANPDVPSTGMRWDRRGGCSCPCSPCFRGPKQLGHFTVKVGDPIKHVVTEDDVWADMIDLVKQARA